MEDNQCPLLPLRTQVHTHMEDVAANADICFPGELRDAFLFAEFPSAKLAQDISYLLDSGERANERCLVFLFMAPLDRTLRLAGSRAPLNAWHRGRFPGCSLSV